MANYSRDATIDAAMQVFGLESFKYQQREAIREFVSGRDVFVSLPTGFGKSYCHTLLTTVFDNLRPHKQPSIMLCLSPYCSSDGTVRQTVYSRIIAIRRGWGRD